MRSTLLALLYLTLAVQGCTQYTPPLSGPTANLRFLTLPGNKTEIHVLEEARCDSAIGASVAVIGQALHNETGQGRSVGMPLGELLNKANVSETIIRSGSAFAAQIEAAAAPGPKGESWRYEKCRKRFVLKPKVGVNYEIHIEQYQEGCTLNAFRLTREAGTYVRHLADAEVTRCR